MIFGTGGSTILIGDYWEELGESVIITGVPAILQWIASAGVTINGVEAVGNPAILYWLAPAGTAQFGGLINRPLGLTSVSVWPEITDLVVTTDRSSLEVRP